MTPIPDSHVLLRFGKGIPGDFQGRGMLALEKMLREWGVPAEVYKETKEDDSKLRLTMTDEKRKTL